MQNSRKGFTLIELMVVAVIVAILAAVLIPLIAGNKDRAYATEGQAGISSIRTAIRVFEAEHAALPTAAQATPIDALPGIGATDLNGTYFNNGSYTYAPVAGGGYTITATGMAGSPAAGRTVILTVAAGGSTSWSGTLIQ